MDSTNKRLKYDHERELSARMTVVGQVVVTKHRPKEPMMTDHTGEPRRVAWDAIQAGGIGSNAYVVDLQHIRDENRTGADHSGEDTDVAMIRIER